MKRPRKNPAAGAADDSARHRQTRPLSESKEELAPLPVGHRVGPEPHGPAGKTAGRFGEHDPD